MSGAGRSMQKAIVRLFRMTLGLYQQYVQAPRLVQIAGPQNELDVVEFLGADLTGFDVRLEPRGGLERLAQTAAASAEEHMASGMLDPATGMELSQTGLSETVAVAQQKSLIHRAIEVFMAEGHVEPPEVEPALAIEVLTRAVFSRPQLQPLLDEYRARLDEQQRQPPQVESPAGMSPVGPGGA
jgi:hypothetical protein